MDHFYCYGEVRVNGLELFLRRRGFRQMRKRIKVSQGGTHDLHVLVGRHEEPTGFWLPGHRTLQGLSEVGGDAYTAPEYPRLLETLMDLPRVDEGRLHVYHEYGEQEGCRYLLFDQERGWLRQVPVDLMVPIGSYDGMMNLVVETGAFIVVNTDHKPDNGHITVEIVGAFKKEDTA